MRSPRWCSIMANLPTSTGSPFSRCWRSSEESNSLLHALCHSSRHGLPRVSPLAWLSWRRRSDRRRHRRGAVPGRFRARQEPLASLRARRWRLDLQAARSSAWTPSENMASVSRTSSQETAPPAIGVCRGKEARFHRASGCGWLRTGPPKGLACLEKAFSMSEKKGADLDGANRPSGW